LGDELVYLHSRRFGQASGVYQIPTYGMKQYNTAFLKLYDDL
jgi:hypothetical protein